LNVVHACAVLVSKGGMARWVNASVSKGEKARWLIFSLQRAGGSGFRFQVSGLGSRSLGFGFRVSGFGSRVRAPSKASWKRSAAARTESQLMYGADDFSSAIALHRAAFPCCRGVQRSCVQRCGAPVHGSSGTECGGRERGTELQRQTAGGIRGHRCGLDAARMQGEEALRQAER